MKTEYHKKVENYYNTDASDYDKRQANNKTTHKIRGEFQKITSNYLHGKRVLDFGCGVGVDITHFAKNNPKMEFVGVDISEKMLAETQKKIDALQLKNVTLLHGSLDVLPNKNFDVIYIFFGALNTVENLEYASKILYTKLNPNGILVATFVNRWFFQAMITQSIQGKFSNAFRRLQKVWGGYSPKNFLPSKTYKIKEIHTSFSKFKCVKRKGFSIVYPAWYQDHLVQKMGRLASVLWKLDQLLNHTFFWSWGEYVLFVFKKEVAK